MLNYYKIFLILVCEVLVTRTLISSTVERLRDFSMVAIIIAGFTIQDFVHFNQFILVTTITIGFVTGFDVLFRERLESEEKQKLKEEISILTMFCSQQKFTLDRVNEYQKDLVEFRDSKYKDFIAAAQMLYAIPELKSSPTLLKECERVVEDCIEAYNNATQNKHNIIDLYDDVSTEQSIKHNIRELKRIKRENDIGLKFNIFLENQIQKLEVMLDVNRRINNQYIKSKQRFKSNHSKRKPRRRE